MDKNRYLEKIAEQKGKDSKWEPGKAFAASVLGGVASVPLVGLQLHLSKKVREGITSNHSEADLKTVKKMIRDNKINVTFNNRKHNIEKEIKAGPNLWKRRLIIEHANSPIMIPNHGKGKDFVSGVRQLHVAYGKGPFGSNKLVTRSVNKDVIMHELGHAKDFSKLKKLKIGGMYAGHYGATGAGALLIHKDTRDYAVPAAALATIPTLRAEAVANINAYKGIKAHKGVDAANRFVKRFVPHQMGAYGAVAAAQVGGMYAAKKLMDHWDKDKK